MARSCVFAAVATMFAGAHAFHVGAAPMRVGVQRQQSLRTTAAAMLEPESFEDETQAQLMDWEQDMLQDESNARFLEQIIAVEEAVLQDIDEFLLNNPPSCSVDEVPDDILG